MSSNEKNVEFTTLAIKLHGEGKTLQDLATASNLKLTSVVQKCASLRKIGMPIPHFTRGRTASSNVVTDEQLRQIAAATGKTVEELKAAAHSIQEASAKHSAAVKAGKVKAASTPSTEEKTSSTEETATTETV